jgi:hypothetical protein
MVSKAERKTAERHRRVLEMEKAQREERVGPSTSPIEEEKMAAMRKEFESGLIPSKYQLKVHCPDGTEKIVYVMDAKDEKDARTKVNHAYSRQGCEVTEIKPVE